MAPSHASGQLARIGPYQIERRLPKGGMADVYRAYDAKRRIVALKVAAADNGAALHTEAETLPLLRHRNIVRILPIPGDNRKGNVYVGTDTVDGRAVGYVALEYVDGGSLEQLILARARRSETFTPGEVLRVAQAVGRALDYAHARGILHLDVKPANILLSRDRRRIVLSDFGLGHRIGAERRPPGLGTPLYISPEQAQGRELDARSDLYSLGVVLYQLATGRVAHDGTWDEVFRQLREGVPIVHPARARRRLPLGVQKVLLRALDGNPNQRFPTGAAMAAALRAATPGQLDRLTRSPALRVAGACAVVLAVLILVVVARLGRESSHPLLPVTATPTLVVVDPGRARVQSSTGPLAPTATLVGEPAASEARSDAP